MPVHVSHLASLHALLSVPLQVGVSPSGGVTFTGAQSSARVLSADIAAGSAVVHVIDEVLLP